MFAVGGEGGTGRWRAGLVMGRGKIGVGVGCCLPDGLGGWLERAIDGRARTCGEGRKGDIPWRK